MTARMSFSVPGKSPRPCHSLMSLCWAPNGLIYGFGGPKYTVTNVVKGCGFWSSCRRFLRLLAILERLGLNGCREKFGDLG